MKIKVEARPLKRALQACNLIAPVSSAVVEEKTGVFFETKDKSVELAATDGDFSLRVEIPAEIEIPGRALVRCAVVSNSISASFKSVQHDSTPVIISLDATSGDVLKVSGFNHPRKDGPKQKVYRVFPLLNAEFFIEPPSFDPSKAVLVPSARLIDGLRRVSYAASKTADRAFYNCISVEFADDGLVFAATDGVQIAEYKCAAEVAGLRGSFVLPLKFATVIERIVNPEKEEQVRFYVDKGKAFLQVANMAAICSLVASDFPDYRPYLSTDGLFKASFYRDDFLSTLQGLAPIVDARSRRLTIEASATGVATLLTSSLMGEAESTGIEVRTEKEFTLAFDQSLLYTAVSHLEGDYFDLYFKDDAKGVLLKSDKDDTFTAFVCTLRQS